MVWCAMLRGGSFGGRVVGFFCAVGDGWMDGWVGGEGLGLWLRHDNDEDDGSITTPTTSVARGVWSCRVLFHSSSSSSSSPSAWASTSPLLSDVCLSAVSLLGSYSSYSDGPESGMEMVFVGLLGVGAFFVFAGGGRPASS